MALQTLPYKERTSLLLFYMKGYSIKEIARIVDCSEDAVKKQLSRGRDHLKQKIKR
jgi:RNA polymerase sigma-70 factor (ECF subfamily)